MQIVITHGYTDLNKGDAAIAFGTIAALRRLWPEAQLKSHSIFSEAHVDFEAHSSLMRQAGHPVVEGVLPSPYLEDRASGLLVNSKASIRLLFELLCLAILWFMPVLAFLHPRKARALGELQQADLVIVRGGQYLHNESGRVRGLLFLGRMLLNIAIPIWLNTPTVIWGLSIGPVHGRLANWCLRQTLPGCRQIIVREKYSADYLHQLGISHNVSVAPDLAFLTVPTLTETIDALLPPPPRIAVTILNWSFPGHRQPAQALQNYLDAVFQTLVAAYQLHGLAPVLVQQVTARHHGHHDTEVIRKLYERLQLAGIPGRFVDADLPPNELSALYGQCQIGLASRLHSIILAACAGTPSIGISYQGFKTRGIMDALGLGHYVQDIDDLNPGAMIQLLERLLAQGGAIRSDLLTRTTQFRQELAAIAELKVASSLRSPEMSAALKARMGAGPG